MEVPPALLISGSGKRYVIRKGRKKRIKSKLTNKALLQRLLHEFLSKRREQDRRAVTTAPPYYVPSSAGTIFIILQHHLLYQLQLLHIRL